MSRSLPRDVMLLKGNTHLAWDYVYLCGHRIAFKWSTSRQIACHSDRVCSRFSLGDTILSWRASWSIPCIFAHCSAGSVRRESFSCFSGRFLWIYCCLWSYTLQLRSISFCATCRVIAVRDPWLASRRSLLLLWQWDSSRWGERFLWKRGCFW